MSTQRPIDLRSRRQYFHGPPHEPIVESPALCLGVTSSRSGRLVDPGALKSAAWWWGPPPELTVDGGFVRFIQVRTDRSGRAQAASTRARAFQFGLTPQTTNLESIDMRPLTLLSHRTVDPYALVPGSERRWGPARQVFDYPPLWRLWDTVRGHTLIDIDPAVTEFDLTSLLPAGMWTLGLTRVDVYSNESDPATIEIEIDGAGAATTELVDPTNVYAEPLAAGAVRLTFHAVQPATPASGSAQQVMATEFEVADAADLGTILATITRGGRSVIREDLTGFTHGQQVRLRVRSTDAPGSATGPWIKANTVAADAQAPPTPGLYTGD